MSLTPCQQQGDTWGPEPARWAGRARGAVGGTGVPWVSPPALPSSHQVPTAIDVDAVGGGLGLQHPVFLHEVGHGLLDGVVPPAATILLLLLWLLPWQGGQQRRCRHLRLCLDLPHRRERRVAATFGLFALRG